MLGRIVWCSSVKQPAVKDQGRVWGAADWNRAFWLAVRTPEPLQRTVGPVNEKLSSLKQVTY